MKLSNIKYIVLLLTFGLLTACSDEANDEEKKEIKKVNSTENIFLPDFSGNYSQVDFIGRPETTLNYILDPKTRDKFNQITAKEQSKFAPVVKQRLIDMHKIFDASFEANYLGLNLNQFSDLMSKNVLQVSFDEKTSYKKFTGRTLKDDVIDIMLSQMFGGEKGDRFNGQDTDGDGVADLPILVSDNLDARYVNIGGKFPYLGTPYVIN